MEEPISRYFQMGTLTWMSFPSLSTLEAVKRVAADEYFTAVEVRSCRDDAEREEVRRVLEQAHLTVYYGAHPDLLSMKLNPNAVDEAERQRAETFLKHAVLPGCQGNGLSGWKMGGENEGAGVQPAFKDHDPGLPLRGGKGTQGGAGAV